MIIDADDENTWPLELLDLLSKYETEIRAYHLERHRIDIAANDDVKLRWDRPPNPHGPIWGRVLREACDAVRGKFLVGFHATRLTEDEIQSISTAGLATLSRDLLERRLIAAQQSGQLSAELAARLRRKNQVEDGNRANRIWFCLTREQLNDESGMIRLFRSWGGEGLYNSHERDKDTGPALRAIGSPCLVVVSVPIDSIECFKEVGERLLNAWCSRRDIDTGHSPTFEGYIDVDVPADGILRILRLADEEFRELTNHNNWREPLE